MNLIGRKLSIMLSDESTHAGVLDDIVLIGDQEFFKFKSGRMINAGFILEIYIYEEAKVIQFRPKSVTT